MAFYLGSVELPTQKKQQMVDITARVRAEVKSSGVQNGLCTVFAPHTTGAITINENTDPDVQTDILNALERAVPQKEKYYKHEEGNAHAHAKAAVASALIADGSPRTPAPRSAFAAAAETLGRTRYWKTTDIKPDFCKTL